MEPTNTHAKFLQLPQDIRDWLSSDEVLHKSIELNKRLNLYAHRPSVIPLLVLRLITQDIEPQNFAPTLAIQLNISDSAAKAITKEVELEFLHPIEEALRKIGVEVQMLHFSGEQVPTTLPQLPDETPMLQPQKVPDARKFPPQHIAPTATIPQSTPQPSTAARPIEPTGPMIIHSEQEEAKPIEQSARPKFMLKIPTAKKQYVSPTPPTARIEMPESATPIAPRKPDTSEEKLLPPFRPLSDLHRANIEQKGDDKKAQSAAPIAPTSAALSPRLSGTLSDIAKKSAQNLPNPVRSLAPKSAATPIENIGDKLPVAQPTTQRWEIKLPIATPMPATVKSPSTPTSAAPRNAERAPIESPKIISSPTVLPTPPVIKRVVHYSEYRTPL